MIYQEPGNASEKKSLSLTLRLHEYHRHHHTSWAIFLISSQVETVGSPNHSVYMIGTPQWPLLAELLQHSWESQVHHTPSLLFPMHVP